MVVSKSYQQFRIEVRPSPETNDHEVRFFADGEDLIARFWSDMMGLDPDDILVNPCPLHAKRKHHKATVARCNCGVIVCDSIGVDIARSSDSVEWSWGNPESRQLLRFIASNYDAEVNRALTDTSWETPDRTAARLFAGQVDRPALARYRLTFTWASGRVRKDAFSIAFRLEPGPYQILVHLPWRGESPEEIVRKSANALRAPPSDWWEAEWNPQEANLGPPSLAGPSWRQGGLTSS